MCLYALADHHSCRPSSTQLAKFMRRLSRACSMCPMRYTLSLLHRQIILACECFQQVPVLIISICALCKFCSTALLSSTFLPPHVPAIVAAASQTMSDIENSCHSAMSFSCMSAVVWYQSWLWCWRGARPDSATRGVCPCQVQWLLLEATLYIRGRSQRVCGRLPADHELADVWADAVMCLRHDRQPVCSLHWAQPQAIPMCALFGLVLLDRPISAGCSSCLFDIGACAASRLCHCAALHAYLRAVAAIILLSSGLLSLLSQEAQ